MKRHPIVDNYKPIELTHSINENSPVWTGSTPFSRILKMDYDQLARIYDYHHTESIGTHIDAPRHFFPQGKSIDQLSLDSLISPSHVIDIRAQCSQNADYALSLEDVNHYEQQHGKITTNSLVFALSGWSERWNDPTQYLNQDEKGCLHFPGFSKEAASFLIERNINGIGIDTMSLDPGYNLNFPVHKHILGNDLFQIENLTNLAMLPPKDALIIALPLKISDGPEAPTRIIALCKKTDR